MHRVYKKKRKCEIVCNSVFGELGCTTVEAGEAGCSADLSSASNTVRVLAWCFGVPLAAAIPSVFSVRAVFSVAVAKVAASFIFIFYYPVAAFAMWLTWGKQQGFLSLPACASITTFLGAPDGTTFDSLGFYAPYESAPGSLGLGAAIVATCASAGLLLLGVCKLQLRL